MTDSDILSLLPKPHRRNFEPTSFGKVFSPAAMPSDGPRGAGDAEGDRRVPALEGLRPPIDRGDPESGGAGALPRPAQPTQVASSDRLFSAS